MNKNNNKAFNNLRKYSYFASFAISKVLST